MKQALVTVALVLAAAVPARADGPLGKTDVFASTAAFSHATKDHTRYDPRGRGFRLQDDPSGGFVREGSFTLNELHYGFGFNRVVPSWNADCPPGTYVKVELQSSPDGGDHWSSWYEVARWGDAELVNAVPKAARVKSDAMGKVNEDTLELKEKADRLRCKVSLYTTRPEVSPLVSLVALSVVDKSQTLKPDNSRGPAWGKEVPADFRSQTVENADMSYRICGPTSTGMMLTAHGLRLPTTKVASACWDELNGIYGNWPFIAAGASALMRANADALPAKAGKSKVFRSYVEWAPDWKAAEREILNGTPCVVSIRFKPNELKNAPIKSTDGHLILVRGFTKEGNVIVNDPAGKNDTRGRVVYDRNELHAARHGGPIIVFRPYE